MIYINILLLAWRNWWFLKKKVTLHILAGFKHCFQWASKIAVILTLTLLLVFSHQHLWCSTVSQFYPPLLLFPAVLPSFLCVFQLLPHSRPSALRKVKKKFQFLHTVYRKLRNFLLKKHTHIHRQQKRITKQLLMFTAFEIQSKMIMCKITKTSLSVLFS